MLSKIISSNLINYNVLRPVNPYNLDIDYMNLSSHVNNYLRSRMDYYKDSTSKNLIIESQFSEWWLKSCSNGRRINGNKGMDIITKQNMAIDASCLCISGNYTNVKSIISYYKIDDEYEDVKINLYNKINNFCDKYKISKLYYCIFISDNKNVYLSTFQFNINNIQNLLLNDKSNNIIYLDNFIDPKYGYVKLNLQQRRLELRLNSNVINKFNTLCLF